MIGIEKIVVGQLRANCYLVYDKTTKGCVIIDPGDEADFITQKITDLNLIPKLAVATHAHFDHIQAAVELKLAYKIPFLLHKADEVLLRHYRKSAIRFTMLDPGPAPIPDGYLKRNIDLRFKIYDLRIIHTPGHTPGGICLYSKTDNALFSGDSIFANGEVGRTDFAYCNKRDLDKSIKKILSLPKETVIYPGHGEETTIEKESKYYK